MGRKITVAEYKFSDDDQRWQYHEVYWGDSWWAAIKAARKAKRRSGCVKIEWR